MDVGDINELILILKFLWEICIVWQWPLLHIFKEILPHLRDFIDSEDFSKLPFVSLLYQDFVKA